MNRWITGNLNYTSNNISYVKSDFLFHLQSIGTYGWTSQTNGWGIPTPSQPSEDMSGNISQVHPQYLAPEYLVGVSLEKIYFHDIQ